jgi:NADPH:quinone reductase-like Zn-dependent oxidoreductase
MSGAPNLTPSSPSTMKAWTFNHYGSTDVLEFQEVPLPSFKDENEVLVRVESASINPTDKFLLKPPFFLRRQQGMLRPKLGRLGSDLSGQVEAVGKNVTEFHAGDKVFGVGRGTLAEHAVADQSELVMKPPTISAEQVAALPIAATTALQGLRDKAQVRPGQRVLVNGASGGVGTFAVQIAKALGAEVDGVCSTQNVELAKSLGAARVFDYSKEDFSKSGLSYDVIFDTQLNRPLSAYRRVLRPGGMLLMVGAGSGPAGRLLFRLLGKSLGSRFVGPKTKFFIARMNKQDLNVLSGMIESGKIASVVDQRFPLPQARDAMRYLMDGHARGKIVITF